MSQQITYRQDILVNAPPDHVWQLVATEDGLRQWWGNTIHLEAKEGGRCEEWRVTNQRMVHWQGVVTLYAPPNELLMTLRAQDKHATAPELTTISISLKGEGTQTRVHVTQRAFGPAPTITTSPLPDTVAPTAYPSMPMSQLNQQHPNQPGIHVPPNLPSTSISPNEQSLIQQMQQQWQQRIHHLAQMVASSTAQSTRNANSIGAA